MLTEKALAFFKYQIQEAKGRDGVTRNETLGDIQLTRTGKSIGRPRIRLYIVITRMKLEKLINFQCERKFVVAIKTSQSNLRF